MKVIRHLGVDLTNVHAAGGVEMMSEALDELSRIDKLIAVTQLTSTRNRGRSAEQAASSDSPSQYPVGTADQGRFFRNRHLDVNARRADQ